MLLCALLVGSFTVATVAVGLVSGTPHATAAFPNSVVDGCTIVANPTAADFTNCPSANLSTANLSGVDLSYADLSDATFADCQDTPFHCSVADLDNADLNDANVSGAGFAFYVDVPPPAVGYKTAHLSGATLTGVNATGANLDAVDLSDVDLTDATLSSANLADGTNFTGAILTNANLTGALAPSAGFMAADLSGADLSGANLSGAVLTNATLSNTDFSEAALDQAGFSGTALVPSDKTVPAMSSSGTVVTWPIPVATQGANPGTCQPASGSSFPIGTTAVQCDVVGGENASVGGGINEGSGTFQVLVDMVIDGCTIVPHPTQADFTSCPGANLSGANLSGLNLMHANFSDANLSDAQLESTDLSSSILTSTNFTGSSLNEADLDYAHLAHADFSGAHLSGATLTDTALVPSDPRLYASTDSGAIVTWAVPAAMPGATPGACDPTSGSLLPVRATAVECTVVDGEGGQATGTFMVDVGAPSHPSTLTITTTALPLATVGVHYSARLMASGGNTPYVWRYADGASGTLPRGLHLDRSTGEIAGVVKRSSQTATFTVEVLDTRTTTRHRTRGIDEATFSISVSH